MAQTAARPTDARPGRIPPARGHIGRVVTTAVAVGAVLPAVLVLGVFAGSREHVITGSALLGFAGGWGLLALVSERRTDQPQRWALVPATVLALTGALLVLTAPGNEAMTVLGWVWPPGLLVLAGWMFVQARRHLRSRTRAWLVQPVCVLTALTAVAGGLETVRATVDPVVPAAASRLHDVGGHRLYLQCTGSGSPAVVLTNGFGEHTASWAWITPSVARHTRVCSYDRAGQGWSDDAGAPQDGVAVAADLRALLAAADVPGPYVLVGHSVGGTYDLVFAERYPDDVAGIVLLDSSSPEQFALPDYPAAYELGRRTTALYPSLARLGLARLAFGSGPEGLPPDARAQEGAFASSARDLRGQRDEWSQLPAVFRQARALTDLGTPLLVITAGEGQQAGWAEAQDELAALSTDGVHRTVDGATHMALLNDRAYAVRCAGGIRDLVRAVRTGEPLRPWHRH
jgi:pimeloyl-ACP methyl ester carboxylesterase